MSNPYLLLHAAGLFVTYSTTSYLRNKILSRTTYGPNHSHFTSEQLLNFFSELTRIVLGVLLLLFVTLRGRGEGIGLGVEKKNFGDRFVHKLKPANHFLTYSALSIVTFLSSACQSGAWHYASSNARALAQSAKVGPVILIGFLIFGKRYRAKEWVATCIFLIGCTIYIVGAPTPSQDYVLRGDARSGSLGLTSIFFMLGYLVTQGLSINVQEKLNLRAGGSGLGRVSEGEDGNPVLDQMIWTSIFSALIALETVLVSNSSGQLLNNVLLLSNPFLLRDILLSSTISSLGFLLLLSTIKLYGALTTSFLLSVHQIFVLLFSAHSTSTLTSTSVIAWTGLGWTFSALYIKLSSSHESHSRRFELKKLALVPDEIEELKGDRERDMDGCSVGSGAGSESGSPKLGGGEGWSTLGGSEETRKSTGSFSLPIPERRVRQYLGPLFVPVILSLVFAPILQHGSRGIISSHPLYHTKSIHGDQSEFRISHVPKADCWRNETTEAYHTEVKTAFATFPRSGDGFTRSLLERVTGYQTSSVYCDKGLEETFKGECDGDANFFIKTHFPSIPIEKPPGPPNYFTTYNQAFHLVRNPIDAITSWFQLDNVGLDENGHLRHDAKLDMIYSEENAGRMLAMAESWRVHALYWTNAPLLTYTMRYEDLRASPGTSVVGLLGFLLPHRALPSLSDLECLMEPNLSLPADKTKTHRDFASWEQWDPDLRRKVLDIVRRPFCAFGYDKLFLRSRAGDGVEEGGRGPRSGDREMREFCKDIGLLEGEKEKYNLGWEE